MVNGEHRQLSLNNGSRVGNHSESLQKSREEVACAARVLHQRGWTPATSSNFSVRATTETFFVSESGLDKGQLEAQHFLEVDLYGHPVPGEQRRPSAETGLHAILYRAYSSVGCVLHTHSMNATVLSRLFERQGHVRLEGYELLKALNGIRTHEVAVDIPVFPNSQQIPELAADVGQWLEEERSADRQPWAFLIAGHGIYVWGQSVDEALRHIEAIDFLLGCELQQASLGAALDLRYTVASRSMGAPSIHSETVPSPSYTGAAADGRL